MRIGLDARVISPHFPGIGRYTANLLDALGEIEQGPMSVVVTQKQRRSDTRTMAQLAHSHHRVTAIDASIFDLRSQISLPRALVRARVEAIHSPYYVVPPVLPCPLVLTLFDLIAQIYPQTLLSWRSRVVFQFTTLLAVHRARVIIVPSIATKSDLLTHFSIDPRRVTVIPIPPDPMFKPASRAAVKAMRQKYNLSTAYVLGVAINKPHKNLAGLITAFARIVPSVDESLVVVGPIDRRFPSTRTIAEQMGVAHRVRELGTVPDEDLAALYSGAELFVCPSLYEGFGLPPLEAMACGTAVACSNRGSLPEVVGDAALKFDPSNTVEIGDAIQRVLFDKELKLRLRSDSLAQASTFHWNDVARQTWGVYTQAVG